MANRQADKAARAPTTRSDKAKAADAEEASRGERGQTRHEEAGQGQGGGY